MTRLIPGLLVLVLLWGVPAEAQHRWCGGHRIHWVGGAPGGGPGRASVDRTPAGGGRPGAAGRYDPTHYEGANPAIEEPPGLNRGMWEALVFNAWENPATDHPPLGRRRTHVIHRDVLPTIRLCIQSPETSATGRRLERYANTSWWRDRFADWTGLTWNGEIRVAACTEQPSEGWIHVRELRPDEPEPGGPYYAAAYTEQERLPHNSGRWLWSEIFYNPAWVEELDEPFFELVLAHEFGHTLGFDHVPAADYVLGGASRLPGSDEERMLAQLAYRVGPGVAYPGLVRGTEPLGDDADRDVLEMLYEATEGRKWTERSNWNTDEPLGRWHGVITHDSGRISELTLHANNLSGAIPAALSRLAGLEILELYENNLTGTIPPELGRLSELYWLDLQENDLTGPIPSELAGLAELRWIDLTRNDLTGSIPPELGRLTNLRRLSVIGNKLTGRIPPQLGDLSALTHLSVATNELSGRIPPELGQLSDLDVLLLSFNDLTGTVPAELGDLSQLRVLLLDHNALSGPLPASFTKLQNLQSLTINDNAGLCAPDDDAFQEWLATLLSFRGETCGAEAVPALPVGGALLLGALLLRRGAVRARSQGGGLSPGW